MWCGVALDRECSEQETPLCVRVSKYKAYAGQCFLLGHLQRLAVDVAGERVIRVGTALAVVSAVLENRAIHPAHHNNQQNKIIIPHNHNPCILQAP